MPTREQVRQLLDDGMDYEAAGQRLGIPPGQAYLIATGMPASQDLANPPHDNPATKDSVAAWLKARVAADGQMRAALRARSAEPPETDPELERDRHDAITVLGRQHSQVRYLLKELQALPGHATGGSAEQMARRKSIVDIITARLAAHEAIEEEHFWPKVRKALPDGGRYADQATEQEQQGQQTLTELGRLDADSREFDERVERLVAQVRKHVAFEEQVFLKVREAMSDEVLDRLGEKLLSASKAAPTGAAKRTGRQGGA